MTETTVMTPTAPPVLDFSPFYGSDSEAKAHLVDQIRKCCLYNGFFQVTGHRVSRDLQLRVMNCAKRFFNLPLEEKTKIDKGWSPCRAELTDTDRHRPRQIAPRSTAATNFSNPRFSSPEPVRRRKKVSISARRSRKIIRTS